MAESAARLLQLLSLLTSRPQWTAVDLAERLEVTDRTLRRDIERLRALGYPVHSARGVAGGYRLGAGRVLPPLLLDDEEATAVVIALRTAAIGGVAGIAETAVSALAKLEQVLPARLRHRIASLPQATVLLPRAAAMADPQTLTLLAAGCYHQHRVRFAYTDRHARPSTRSVGTGAHLRAGKPLLVSGGPRPGPCRLAGLQGRQDHRSARHRCPVHPARPARCRRTRRGCRDDRAVPPPRQSPAAYQR